MVAWIIIMVLLLLLAWLLFAPVILRINTRLENYSVSLPGIFAARFVQDEREFYLRVRVLLITFRIGPGDFASRGRGKKWRRKPPGKVSVRYLAMAVKEILRSFRLKYLHMSVDTEDCQLNAMLVPVFLFINTERISVNVNFMEENSLAMDLRNRLANFLWTYIKYKYRTIVKP